MDFSHVVLHRLGNGATVIPLSPGHGFKFSDGTACGPQNKEVCDFFTLQRESLYVRSIKGMSVNQIRMQPSDEQIRALRRLAKMADLVMAPLPLILGLREAGVRIEFPNVVAMNATPETMRSAPAEKVVDITNWSY